MISDILKLHNPYSGMLSISHLFLLGVMNSDLSNSDVGVLGQDVSEPWLLLTSSESLLFLLTCSTGLPLSVKKNVKIEK